MALGLYRLQRVCSVVVLKYVHHVCLRVAVSQEELRWKADADFPDDVSLRKYPRLIKQGFANENEVRDTMGVRGEQEMNSEPAEHLSGLPGRNPIAARAPIRPWH